MLSALSLSFCVCYFSMLCSMVNTALLSLLYRVLLVRRVTVAYLVHLVLQ